jgi:cell division protein FtsW
MSSISQVGKSATATRFGQQAYDWPLLVIAGALLALGLLMVASASMPLGDRVQAAPFYFFQRQGLYLLLGIGIGIGMLKVPMRFWEARGFAWMGLGLLLLLVVLIPGLGRVVNGSSRWLDLRLVRVQASEPARLLLLMYLSGYLVRRSDELRTQLMGSIKPMFVLALASLLLLMEPDFGSAVVLVATAMAMMYLAGVRLAPFVILFALCLCAMILLVWTSPYRMERLTGFLNPWSDPFDTGFQLTQSLIAIGSGHWFGLGLGESIQKMYYLPEAHTDFLFAILAEELGFVGAAVVIVLYLGLLWRAMVIANRAAALQQWFSAYLAYGIGIWLGLQAFINMGVNMGALPTKGLTLPMMSYGGSSLVSVCLMLGILLRVDLESRQADKAGEYP